MPKKYASQFGLTLIELMIVIILIAIGASLAAPSFSNIIRDTRLTTQANSLLSSLQLARSEAVSRGVQVSIRRTSSEWDGGWQVFTDWDADGNFDGNANVTNCAVEQDCLLRTSAAMDAGYTLRTGNNYDNWLAFLPSGLPVSSGGLGNDTFRLCDKSAKTEYSRSIIVNNTGRPAVTPTASECP